MLPNVVGSKFDERVTDFNRLRLPTAGNGVGSRRALSSKSAHLTTIPFEPSFVSTSQSQKRETQTQQRKPYLPYSASLSRQRSNTQNQNAQLGGKNGVGTNGFKSEYSFRARAHSHKSGKLDTSNGTLNKKSIQHLLEAKKSGVRKSNSPINEVLDLNGNNEPSTRQSLLETDAKEMVMMGTGKAPLVGGNAPLIASKVQSTKDRFQVCRTKEEKEKNPDCIRLDKSALRLFPDIGGGESVTLKMLSLQHNLITRLENVPLLSQLVVLDLYDNRVERISGLQGLPSLRVLLLGKNRIKRIEGMDNLKRLEILDLHGNQLRYVDNLGPLSALRVLNLAGNLLRNIRTLGPYGMTSLTELNLKRNRIKNLDGLQKAPHLKRLLIANNELQSIATLAPLRKLLFLEELVIDPNPITTSLSSSEYKNQVLTLFPNLNSLDRTSVTDEMKQNARLWHKMKLAEEEAKKKEEARIRQEMVATIGPPGSREQVIYQARRRWESLRNFVKSTNPTVSVEVKPKPIKNLKDAVSATISARACERPRPNFNELYPPATLDLEHFPDGQTELEKMESLLGEPKTKDQCVSIQLESEKEKSKQITAIKEDKREELFVSNNSKFQAELTSTKALESSQNAPKAETPKDPANKETNPGPLSLKVTKLVTDSSCQTKTNQSTRDAYSSPSANFECPHKVIDVEANETISSARSNLSNSSRPENRSSTKVAVVRPLIRDSDEDINKNFQNSDIGPVNVGAGITPSNANSITITKKEQVEPQELSDPSFQKERLPDNNSNIHDLPKGNDDDGKSNVAGDLNVSNHRPPVVGVESKSRCPENIASAESSHIPQKESQVQSSDNTSKPKEEGPKSTSTTTLAGPDDIPTSQSLRTKAKLLRHLRSISLDSGMQPPPGLDTPIEVSNGSPEDNVDVEDEDDNDIEVKDLECDYDYEDDACSLSTSTITTGTSASTTPRRSSTVIATTNRLLKGNGSFRKQTFPRTKSQRMKLRDRAAKLYGSSSDLSPRSNTTTTAKRISSGIGPRNVESQGISHTLKVPTNGKALRRCDSAVNLCSSHGIATTSAAASASVLNGTSATSKASNVNGNTIDELGGTPNRKQGVDFLVEVEGKALNIFGQGGLRPALTAFTSSVTCHVNLAKFHYITFDSIIPFFGKLRQVYPSLEHFHFRANNLCTLAQLDALSDLQGLTSLCIAKEGNPIVTHDAWVHYASYRLSHWGLQIINGKEISSEYRGGVTSASQAKCFESLGFLALSCLPQTALTPLAKRLHMLHCFCCCSPSTSSDESNRAQRLMGSHSHRIHSPSQQTDHTPSGNFCTAWDDDPVLLDVIGKEALVYCPPPVSPEEEVTEQQANAAAISKEQDKMMGDKTASIKREQFEKKRLETLRNLIKSGVEIAEKVDRLERTWPTLLTDVIQEILMDYRFMDSYMKKELKKAQDATLIASNQPQQFHGKKPKH